MVSENVGDQLISLLESSLQKYYAKIIEDYGGRIAKVFFLSYKRNSQNTEQDLTVAQCWAGVD